MNVKGLILEVRYSEDGYIEKEERFNSFADAYAFADNLDGSTEWVDIVNIRKDGTERVVNRGYR